MGELIVAIWFSCGVFAFFIAELISQHQGEKRPPASTVFLVFSGPILLYLVLYAAVMTALGRKPYTNDGV